MNLKDKPWLKVYGDTEFRGKCPTETLEQVTFFAELKRHYPLLAKLAIHPRNEGKRTHYQSAREKSEGMNPGASDIVIPGSPAFVCELKRQDHTKSRWEPGQEKYLKAAHDAGCFVCVALGYEAALLAIVDYQLTIGLQ